MVDIVEIIDQHMQTRKIMVCKNFRDENYDLVNDDYRATIPVLDQSGNSLQPPLEVRIVCPVGISELKFHISLLVITGAKRNDRKSICRLDFGANEGHRFNPSAPPPEGWDWSRFPTREIHGSHIHPWQLNRHLASGRKLPKNLHFAEAIEAAGWDDAFDAFCEINLITYDRRPHCRRGLL